MTDKGRVRKNKGTLIIGLILILLDLALDIAVYRLAGRDGS